MKTYKKTLKVCDSEMNFKQEKITSSKDAYNYIKQFYSDDIEIYESFFLLLLNTANKTIGFVKISQGGISSATVDVKIIAKYAIDCLATAVVLSHNHPSEDMKPSDNDKATTTNIVNALKLFDITVLDHIILSKNNYFSFADNDLI